MVKILPAKTPEAQAALYALHPVQAGYSCLYQATEDGVEKGWFAVRIDGETLTITQMEVNGCGDEPETADERYFAELMARAASSYAINRMLFVLRYEPKPYRAFLRQFGFSDDETGGLTVDIAQLTHRCGGAH